MFFRIRKKNSLLLNIDNNHNRYLFNQVFIEFIKNFFHLHYLSLKEYKSEGIVIKWDL